MPKRPLLFTLLALLYAVIAISLPIQVMIIYDHQLSEWPLILAKLSWLNILVIMLSSVNVILSLNASHWLKYSLPFTIIIVGINNYFVSYYGNDFSVLETSMATIVFALIHTTLFFFKSSSILEHPSLRWWLVPRRHELQIPVWIEQNDGKGISFKTFDLSKTGAFIASTEPFHHLKEGDQFNLAVRGEDMTYSVKAKIVRKSEPRGHYPRGFAIQFEKMSLGAWLFLMKVRHVNYLTRRFSSITRSR
jgi:hypothetical protein